MGSAGGRKVKRKKRRARRIRKAAFRAGGKESLGQRFSKREERAKVTITLKIKIRMSTKRDSMPLTPV